MAIEFDRSKIFAPNWFRAKVVDNDDPKKEGRIRPMIEPLWGDLDVDEIPWAIPARSMFQGGSDQDYGSFSVPKVDSWVHIEFEHNDPNRMIYKKDVYFEGTTPDRFQGKEDDVFDEIESNLIDDEPSTSISDYPDSSGFISESGIVVEYSDEPRILIFHPSGFRFEILENGDHVKHVEADNYKKVSKDDIITIEGKLDEVIGESFLQEIGKDYDQEVGGMMEQDVSEERVVNADSATIRMQNGIIYLN